MYGQHARLPPTFLGLDDLSTEPSFDSQATWVIGVLGLLCDMLSPGVCITKHWQTAGGLVQELNVCTVDAHHWKRPEEFKTNNPFT